VRHTEGVPSGQQGSNGRTVKVSLQTLVTDDPRWRDTHAVIASMTGSANGRAESRQHSPAGRSRVKVWATCRQGAV